MSRRTGFSAEVRACVLERAGGRCERCGETFSDVEVHHRRPRGSGGTRRPETNLPSNAGALCGACHRWVESYRYDAFEQGWLVRQSHDPADVSVMRRGVRVYLGDAGEVYPWTPDLRVMP